MKHSLYGTLGIFQTNHLLNRIVNILKTNVKTTWTYPKTVWYSLRYNAGEKFRIQDNTLYPYYYDVGISDSSKQEPVRLSTQLLSNTLDRKYLTYAKNSSTLSSLEKYNKDVDKSFKQAFDTLYKSYQYNMQNSDFDMPVAVSARVLYACTYVPNDDHKVLSFILKKFLAKIEYADADSISQVLFSLAHHNYFKPEIWKPILEQFQNKCFDPEFTTVKPSLPHIFRYKEVDNYSFLTQLDNFGNNLFSGGYLAAFEAYSALKKVESTGAKELNVSGLIENLESRLPLLKEKYEEYTNKTKH